MGKFEIVKAAATRTNDKVYGFSIEPTNGRIDGKYTLTVRSTDLDYGPEDHEEFHNLSKFDIRRLRDCVEDFVDNYGDFPRYHEKLPPVLREVDEETLMEAYEVIENCSLSSKEKAEATGKPCDKGWFCIWVDQRIDELLKMREDDVPVGHVLQVMRIAKSIWYHKKI